MRGDMANRRTRQTYEPEAAQLTAPSAPLATPDIAAQTEVARLQPRSILAFRQRVEAVIGDDPAQAQSLIWTRLTDGKLTRGPSVRLAELLQYGFGNMRSSAVIKAIGRDYVESEGVCMDVETNTATAITVRRSTRRVGRRMSHDEVLNTATAAGAVARRNAVLATIPQFIWAPILAQVEALIAHAEEPWDVRVDRLFYELSQCDVPPERVCLALGVDSAEAIDQDMLVTLYGVLASIKDGSADPEELFPDLTPPEPAEGVEGFNLGFVRREISGPTLEAEGCEDLGPLLALEPDPALEPALPIHEEVDPVKTWTDALKARLDAAPNDGAVDDISDRLHDISGGDQGLYLAGKSLVSKRRRELEAARLAPARADATLELQLT